MVKITQDVVGTKPAWPGTLQGHMLYFLVPSATQVQHAAGIYLTETSAIRITYGYIPQSVFQSFVITTRIP